MAEILEQSQLTDENLDELPTDQEAMSPDELQADLGGVDTTAAPQEQDDIPDKYKGKSVQEVVAMHQEAERLIGSQGSEVGELRKVVDTFITNQFQNQTQPEPVEEEVDFFEERTYSPVRCTLSTNGSSGIREKITLLVWSKTAKTFELAKSS